MSPKFPPTPEQRKVTPQQWLSQSLYDEEVMTLDEVRRSLVKDIDAAEEINEVQYSSYRGSRSKLKEDFECFCVVQVAISNASSGWLTYLVCLMSCLLSLQMLCQSVHRPKVSIV